ncbi:MAG: KH domain-containing protein [Eggerthellales bacterium]|nr:KH domain-containing protein [Eggerthellales bacterium]
MPELTEKISGLVETVVRPLIEFEDDFEISAFEESGNTIVVELRVNEADAGKVIGRQGRIIKAVRTIARAAASQENAHVEVELID